MTVAHSPDNPALEDAFYALALDPELLDHLTRQFPQHATELTEFAVELALDEFDDFTGVAVEEESEDEIAATSPSIDRAMNRFRTKLSEARHHRVSAISNESDAAVSARPLGPPPNPFERLNRDEFRAFASSLGANTLFATKLRDRQIDPDTIGDGFVRHVAEKLGEPDEVVLNHLSAPPQKTSAAPQYFKASAKPSTEARQSFADAVKTSGLTKEQQRLLLEF